MTIIAINETNYYNMKDLMELNRDFFHGCISKPKTIINRKKIPETDYIYATFIEKKKKWNITTIECKKSSLLITKEWVDANFFNNKPKENGSDGEESNITELVAKSPPLLELEEHEKFKDMNGNVLEIETRGDKTHRGIFFKVVDVAKAFDMPNLDHTLYHDNRGYHINDDYFTFYIRTKYAIKKFLYLSYYGMQRVINLSRRGFSCKTLFIMNKWLQQFDITNLDSYEIDINRDKNQQIGYVYVATSSILNGVKLGYWTGTAESLMQRYKTYYGSDVEITSFHTTNPYSLEQTCHSHFHKNRLSMELFDKKYFKDYIDYITDKTIQYM